MEGKFVVTFDDDSTEEVTAVSRDAAKDQARAKRVNEIDPAGKLDKNDRTRHPRIKIKSVNELIDGALTLVALTLGALLLYQLNALTELRLGSTMHADVMSLQGYFGTAIGATLAALAAVPGDSLQVPFFPETKRGMILQWWTDVQVAGTARVRSGKWHDNVNGLRKDTIASELNPIMPFGFGQRIDGGDNLVVELAGSAVGGDIEYVCVLQWFEQLTAQQAQFWTPDVVKAKTINYSMVENTIATGATAAWAGSEAINAETDQFHANRSYALVGYCCDTEVPAIAWRGPDTANMRVGGPGLDQDQVLSNNWFERLSMAFNKPLIPIFQANNKGATTIDTLQDENGADTTVISIYAEVPA